MTQTTTSGADRLARIRLYRRLMFGCVLAGTVGLIAAATLGYLLFGVAVYWAGVAAFFAIWRGTSVQLFDERDLALERGASLITLNVVAVLGIVGIPTSVALAELGYFEMPPELVGAFYAYVALFVTFGAAYLWLRYRP